MVWRILLNLGKILMKCTIKSLRIIFETHILIQNKKLPQLRGVFPGTHSCEIGKTGK